MNLPSDSSTIYNEEYQKKRKLIMDYAIKNFTAFGFLVELAERYGLEKRLQKIEKAIQILTENFSLQDKLFISQNQAILYAFFENCLKVNNDNYIELIRILAEKALSTEDINKKDAYKILINNISDITDLEIKLLKLMNNVALNYCDKTWHGVFQSGYDKNRNPSEEKYYLYEEILKDEILSKGYEVALQRLMFKGLIVSNFGAFGPSSYKLSYLGEDLINIVNSIKED